MYSLYSWWLHMVWNKQFQEKFTFNEKKSMWNGFKIYYLNFAWKKDQRQEWHIIDVVVIYACLSYTLECRLL